MTARSRHVAAAVLSTLLVASLVQGANAGGRRAPLEGEGEGLDLIANIPYEGGTDMEFATIKGRDYAFTGAGHGVMASGQLGALRVIDITNPAKPVLKATMPCSLYQADIQISHDRKTLMMSQDGSPGGPDACLASLRTGFMTVDISNPLKPKPVGFAEIARGSHNITAHPTKPYVYNSDSDQVTGGTRVIEIWSIKNPAKPEKVNEVALGVHSPHDISFNTKGTMAVTAARSHFDLLDTTDPENPVLLFTGQCPGCYLTHDAKFTPDGTHIVIGDEAGGGAPHPCPGGALYFYLIQGGEDGPVPVLVGIYEPGEVVFARDGQTSPASCTSHVFDISDDSTKIAISWYSAGTRYLDISNPHGVTFGAQGAGVRELGWFMPENGDSWSSKFHKGPYIYSNDINRGFDVFKITADG